MKVLSFIIMLSFILTILMSAFCIFSAFVYYWISCKTVINTFNDAYYYLTENLKNPGSKKKYFPEVLAVKNDKGEKENYLYEQNLLSKLRSEQDKAIDGNTLSFLFTVFSFTFVAIGIYLLSQFKRHIDSSHNFSKEFVKITRNSSKTASFAHQLLGLNIWVKMAKNAGQSALSTYMPTLREMIKYTLRSIKDLNESNVGFVSEQSEHFADLVNDIQGSLYEMKEMEGLTDEDKQFINQIDESVQDMNTILTETDFVIRFQDQVNAAIIS